MKRVLLAEDDIDFGMIKVSGGREEGPSEGDQGAGLEESSDFGKNVKPKNSGESLWGFFLGAFLFGLAALLTPCVFPMIPMTVAFFTNDQQSKSRARGKALFYGFSIIAIYILIGLGFTSFFGVGLANDLATGAIPNIIFFTVITEFNEH